MLQIAFETFARQYTTLLTTSLRVVSAVSVISIEQQTYDEYVSALPGPSIIARVGMDPLPGTALLEFSLDTALACIDHLLGGAGGEQPNRPLTDIETPLLRGLLDRALGELRYAFEPVAAIQPMLGALEYNPQFAQACAPADPVIVASLEMKVGAAECVATMCMPLAMIFPRLQQRGAASVTDRQRADRELAHRRMVAGLQSAPIDVAVRFAAVRMRAADIIDLRPGDVVPLGHPVTAPLSVTAAGVTFAHAVPGNQGTRLACLVVPPPKENHPS
jgi:flagellar motor switch protein FliM